MDEALFGLLTTGSVFSSEASALIVFDDLAVIDDCGALILPVDATPVRSGAVGFVALVRLTALTTEGSVVTSFFFDFATTLIPSSVEVDTSVAIVSATTTIACGAVVDPGDPFRRGVIRLCDVEEFPTIDAVRLSDRNLSPLIRPTRLAR